MFGILATIIEAKPVRYLLAFLLGATVGTAGGHQILAGIASGLAQLFGIHNIHSPSVHL